MDEKKAVELLESLGYSLGVPQNRLFIIRKKDVNSSYYNYSVRKSTPTITCEYAKIELDNIEWKETK